MLSGEVNEALRLISDTESAGILPTTKQTIDFLKEEHPVGAPKYADPYGTEEVYEEYANEEIKGYIKLHVKSREQ